MSAPDATPARLGPKVTIERDCFGCAFERSERYAVQSDSGCDVKCTHPSHGDGGKYIGDTTWRTPDWCPVTTDATPARGDVDLSHAELVSRELRAFRRLCETPDFQSIRKDRGGNFHVTMRRDDKSQSFVSPTLWEAASRALEANGDAL